MSDEITAPSATDEDRKSRWIKAVAENARRLLTDAALLAEHQRYATAFSLCVLALEEVGKIILDGIQQTAEVQGKRARSNIHVRKQLAATALLQSQLAHHVVMQKLAEWGLSEGDPQTVDQQDELRETLAKAIYESRENRLLELVRMGATERVKHVGIYVDEWHLDHALEPAGFSRLDYESAWAEASRALQLLEEKRLMRLVEVIYNIELQRPHFSPSERLPPPNQREE